MRRFCEPVHMNEPTYHPSYQPFGARYFASAKPLEESDTIGDAADVVISRLPMESMNAPLAYIGSAFGRRVEGPEAKRLKELIVSATETKRMLLRAELEGAK